MGTPKFLTILVQNFELVILTVGIKHGISCINICQIPRKVLKTEAGDRGFHYFVRDLANVNALKKHI